MSSGELGDPRFENDPELPKSEQPLRKGQAAKRGLRKAIDKFPIPKNKFVERELSRVFSDDYDYGVADKTILDPRGPYIDSWNKILIVAYLTSLFVDPLFFLLPRATEEACINVSETAQRSVTTIRTLADLFYITRIFIRFRTAYIAPSSRVFGRGELVVDRSKIASKYLGRDFWLDIVAALPVPQMMVWIVVPSLKWKSLIELRPFILICIVSQYVLRLYLIFPLASKINKATGAVLEAAWAGAAYNLMLYMLACHILGCMWYLLAIERQEDCWTKVCKLEYEDCNFSFLNCNNLHEPVRATWFSSSNITFLCHPQSEFYDYGIYSQALTSGVTFSNFFMTFYYCIYWAMRNLNSMGQELAPSSHAGEITFSMIFGVLALLLFGLLIANMQTYLQSNSSRIEQWRIMKTDTERWMRHRHLPDELKRYVRKFYEQKWCSSRGVDEEAILQSFPSNLRRTIKRHLCLDLIRQVRLFEMMDEQMVDAICEKLRPHMYDTGTCLIREGDPVNDMLFIIRGRLNSYTTDGGRTDFFNSSMIGPGDFCGEELLTWALDPRSASSVSLPSSTRTVIALTEVEAFALVADDLKSVATQFRRLNSKQIRQVFRFHSHHWRTWAACFIQAAWFRYRKRKGADELKRIKRKQQQEKAVPQLLQVASDFSFYAAKLAASTRRVGSKPEDPDFTADTHPPHY